MPKPDDLLATDPEPTAKDVAALVRRFDRVNDILLRAIARYTQITDSLAGAPIPSDVGVQTSLQRIVASAIAVTGTRIPSDTTGTLTTVDGIAVQVESKPGPIQDPTGRPNLAVQQTLQLVVSSGSNLVNDAARQLGITAPCTIGGGITAPP